MTYAVVSAAFALVLPARATAAAPGTLTITPAQAVGISHPGQRVGPFTIINSTRKRFDVTAVPVLLGQTIDGALFVRQDRASRARARLLLRRLGRGRFRLPSGKTRSVTVVHVRRSSRHNFYGGVLFQAIPARRPRGSSLAYILQLNARVWLRPPRHLQRRDARLERIDGEQHGPRALRFAVRFANRGNVDVRPLGTLRVLDALGRLRFRSRIGGFDVLPGYRVDLATVLRRPVLATGAYVVDVRVRVGNKLLRKRTTLRLFGPNAIATRRAELVAFDPPHAVRGENVDLSATYRNTGNVTFAPRAEVSVSGLDGWQGLETERVAPGRLGTAKGSVVLEGSAPRNVRLRLLVGGRVADERTVTVTPVDHPAVGERLREWVIGHALVLVVALVALAAILAATVVALALQARRRLGSAAADRIPAADRRAADGTAASSRSTT